MARQGTKTQRWVFRQDKPRLNKFQIKRDRQDAQDIPICVQYSKMPAYPPLFLAKPGITELEGPSLKSFFPFMTVSIGPFEVDVHIKVA